MSKDRVLLVEQDREFSERTMRFLRGAGFEVNTASTCLRAEQVWPTFRPDVAVLSHDLPDANAQQFVPGFKAFDPFVPLIVLSGYGAIDLAIESVKLGAEQFLTKPVELPTLLAVIQRSLSNRRYRRRQFADELRKPSATHDLFHGQSESIRDLAEMAHQAAISDNPVLIQGEPGTCKSALARWLHDRGHRSSGPFVEVRCADGGDLTTELFGRDEGHAGEPGLSGLVEAAHRGTLFLDCVGDLDPQLQVRLLRLLEKKSSSHARNLRERNVDLRLIAATPQPMADLVRARQFRGDLYFRLSKISLLTPCLRERTEDIPGLCEQILYTLAGDFGLGHLELTADALSVLQGYSWPGNIRELRGVLERAVLRAGASPLAAKDLPADICGYQNLTAEGHFKTLEEMERDYIELVLRSERGRVEAAARKLGIPRSSLYNKLKHYGLDRHGLRTVS